MRNEEAEGDHFDEVYKIYKNLLGQTGESLGKEIAFNSSTETFDDRVLERALPVFEKYAPFIVKHFDHNHQMNLGQIMTMANQENTKRALMAMYPLFDSNPRLLELYSKRSGYVNAEAVLKGINRERRDRLMFTSTPEEELQTVETIRKIIEENRAIFRKLEEKYKDIGEEQIVIGTLFDDAEVCVRFINRNLRPDPREKDGQIRTENTQACQIMIRPNQHESKGKASDFISMTVNLTASGLVSSESGIANIIQGYLFLGPPKGSRIEEKELVELIASDKTDQEIREILEGGATGIAEILTM